MKKLSSWNQWVKQRNLVQWFACDFQIHKKGHLQTLKIFTHTPKHPPDPPPSYWKNNYIKITLKKYTYKSENTLTISLTLNNSHKIHRIRTNNMHKKSSHINNKHTSNVRKNHHTNIMRINILQPLISTKQKYITNACIPKLL